MVVREMVTAETVDIDVAELRKMLEIGQPVTVLDVRAAADRAEWFIPGSRHVDAYEALKAGALDALAGGDRLRRGQSKSDRRRAFTRPRHRRPLPGRRDEGLESCLEQCGSF